MTAATCEDVAVALGRLISDPAEQEQVSYWLSLAEAQIAARLGDVSALNQEALRYVEVEAVVAKVENPTGMQSETIDDYTYRYSSDSRYVNIRDQLWALLEGPRPTVRMGWLA